MKNTIIVELIEICDKKIFHLNRIYELTQGQGQVIAEDKLDKLQNYTHSKQKEIDRINTLDNAFTVKYDQYKKDNSDSKVNKDSILSEEISKLQSKIEIISKLVTSIAELELDNNAKMYDSFNKVKAKLKQIGPGKGALKGYNSFRNTANSPFIDKTK